MEHFTVATTKKIALRDSKDAMSLSHEAFTLIADYVHLAFRTGRNSLRLLLSGLCPLSNIP